MPAHLFTIMEIHMLSQVHRLRMLNIMKKDTELTSELEENGNIEEAEKTEYGR